MEFGKGKVPSLVVGPAVIPLARRVQKKEQELGRPFPGNESLAREKRETVLGLSAPL